MANFSRCRARLPTRTFSGAELSQSVCKITSYENLTTLASITCDNCDGSLKKGVPPVKANERRNVRLALRLIPG
jgi:hypothetical protein